MKWAIKSLIFSVVTIAVIAGIGFLFVSWVFTDFGPHYNKQDLIKNYEVKYYEINELAIYMNSISPLNKKIELEFIDDNNFEFFNINDKVIYESNWKVKVNSKKADSLLKEIGWTKQILATLKNKLDNANCIGISNGEPTMISFKKSNMGMYCYEIFNKPLNDSTKTKFNDGCIFSFYKDNVVLKYDGDEFGRQCFEDFNTQKK